MISFKKIKFIIDKKNYRYLYFIVILLLIQGVIETLSISMIYPLITFFGNNEAFILPIQIQNLLNNYLNVSADNLALLIIIIFCALFIIKFVVQIYILWITSTYFQRLRIYISEKIIKKHFLLINKDISSIKNTSEFSNLVIFESERYSFKYIGCLINILAESLTVIFISIMLFIFSTKYSLLIIFLYSIIVLIMYTLIKNYLKKISYKRLLHQETIIKNTKEGFDGFKDIIINMISNKYIKNYLNNVSDNS